jgi:ABC-type lipoprotein release transport system permease subunit
VLQFATTVNGQSRARCVGDGTSRPDLLFETVAVSVAAPSAILPSGGLAARRSSVVWLVLREALVLVLIGLGAGIALMSAAARLVTSLLFGVSPTDPATLAATAVLMLSIGVVAAYLPARRASRVDPIGALRYE